MSLKWICFFSCLLLVLVASVFFYWSYDLRKFKESLPSVPIVAPDKSEVVPDRSVVPVDTRLTETIESADGPTQDVSTSSEKTVPVEDVVQDVIAPKAGATLETERSEIDLTDEEIEDLFYGLADFDAPYPAEKFELLEDVLHAKFGDDDRVPEFINAFKALHTIGELAKKTQTGDDGDMETFLDQLPVLVVDDFTEISIDLFEFSDEEAAQARARVDALAAQIDVIELIEEAKPMVEEAIGQGELTEEEGLSFLEAITGARIVVTESGK